MVDVNQWKCFYDIVPKQKVIKVHATWNVVEATSLIYWCPPKPTSSQQQIVWSCTICHVIWKGCNICYKKHWTIKILFRIDAGIIHVQKTLSFVSGFQSALNFIICYKKWSNTDHHVKSYLRTLISWWTFSQWHLEKSSNSSLFFLRDSNIYTCKHQLLNVHLIVKYNLAYES